MNTTPDPPTFGPPSTGADECPPLAGVVWTDMHGRRIVAADVVSVSAFVRHLAALHTAESARLRKDPTLVGSAAMAEAVQLAGGCRALLVLAEKLDSWALDVSHSAQGET